MFKRKHERTRGPTEAVASENIRQNSQNFRYPKAGFVTPIEHSLLYSMISSPSLFPASVILKYIQQEGFSQYMYVAQQAGRATRERDEELVSYAQLSALVALAAEQWPVDEKDNTATTSATSSPKNIPQVLYKRVLRCVVQYAEAHDLDRQSEVHELLQPLEEMAVRKSNNTSLAVVLPYYLGITASVVTANPLPMILGSYATCAVAVGSFDKQAKQNQLVNSLGKETKRKADVEKASLLDEVED